MTEVPRYYAAACQTDLPCPRDRDEIAGRVNTLLGMVDRAVIGYEPFFDVKVVVFPEFAHTAPIYETVAELSDRLAVPIPNEHTDSYVRKARDRSIYIQTGTFLEVDSRWPGVVFNTTCLIGPDGLLARYRKVNPWIPWELHASPHDLPGYNEPLFPVVETEIGRLGAAICYDWLFLEAIRALALAGAEVLIRVSAYMDPWGATPPLDWWTLSTGPARSKTLRMSWQPTREQVPSTIPRSHGPAAAWSWIMTAGSSPRPTPAPAKRSWWARSTWPPSAESASPPWTSSPFTPSGRRLY